MSGTTYRLLFFSMVWSVLVVVTLLVLLHDARLLPVVFAFVAVLAGLWQRVLIPIQESPVSARTRGSVDGKKQSSKRAAATGWYQGAC